MPRATAGTVSDPRAEAGARPLYETVLGWVSERLRGRGYPRPLCKRAALLIVGLVAGERATLGALTGTLHGLAVSDAQPESIARRLGRLLEDPRLDPETLLPDLFAGLLPHLLAHQVAAHAANVGTGQRHHRRFVGVRLVVDESSVEGRAHLLVVGLAFQGLVLPLGVRCWRQNAPLAAGAYWVALGELLWQVQRLLPPELREHVLLLADRAYGVPRMLDLLRGLGWHWLLRVQGPTCVQLPDGHACALRDLAPRPGALWLGPPDAAAGGGPGGEAEPELRVFKAAGWRGSRVVAAWAVGEAEPWLLLSSLPATAERLRDYVHRWAIERLFLAWKGRGWDLERCGVADPARLGRLVAGLAAATLWRLALALPVATAQLQRLAARAAGRGGPARQLPLPWAGPSPARRPWAAKWSLLTWGARVALHADLRATTPPLSWELPPWDAPTWSEQCRLAYASAA